MEDYCLQVFSECVEREREREREREYSDISITINLALKMAYVKPFIKAQA